jgi:hypothetical protein
VTIRSLIAEARAIRIPKGKIRKFAEKLSKALHRKVRDSEKPLGTTGSLVSLEFSTKTAAGAPVTALVILRGSPSRGNPDYVLGAGLGSSPKYSGPVIVININGTMPSSHVKSASGPDGGDTMSSRLYNVLAHELTHAMDPGLPMYKGKKAKHSLGGSKIPTEDELDTKAYYNSHEEVRAYARDILTDVEHMISRWDKVGKLWTPTKAMHVLMKNSDTWLHIKPHLNRRNKQKIIKIVATELRDRAKAG